MIVDVGSRHTLHSNTDSGVRSLDRQMAEQFFTRVAGAPLISGNHVRILRDASENYPAWLDAIRNARSWIHFESYIIHDDDVGHTFADALAERAGTGVKVRVLYDWLGAFGTTSRGFWRRLRGRGADVRCFNPPHVSSPFAWASRDHRKSLSIDGEVAFVTGLCVGKRWEGEQSRGREPWRDTGVLIRGPAVADVEQAFARIWGTAGPQLPAEELVHREDIRDAGEVSLRVLAGEPGSMQLYRLDQFIAAAARSRLWLTDAYFIGTTAYIQALRAAARDGVDVRLLVPGSSDLPVIRAISRAAYRPLLDAGVRVFEWRGPMLHAKTAVADGHWTRVGSTNLNPASWLGNWELDVAIDDESTAEAMERMYLEDLDNAVEIVLDARGHVRKPLSDNSEAAPRSRQQGHANRAAAGAIGIGNAVTAAVTDRRELGPAESKLLMVAASLMLGFAIACVFLPRLITIPLAVVCAWVAGALLFQAIRLWRRGGTPRDPA